MPYRNYREVKEVQQMLKGKKVSDSKLKKMIQQKYPHKQACQYNDIVSKVKKSINPI